MFQKVEGTTGEGHGRIAMEQEPLGIHHEKTTQGLKSRRSITFDGVAKGPDDVQPMRQTVVNI